MVGMLMVCETDLACAQVAVAQLHRYVVMHNSIGLETRAAEKVQAPRHEQLSKAVATNSWSSPATLLLLLPSPATTQCHLPPATCHETHTPYMDTLISS